MIGSIWNKWDLHLHSPLTHLNDQFNGVSISDYVDLLASHELALVGITNYFYFSEGELEIVREEVARKGLNIAVLGNVEFRLTQQNKDGEWINLHAIFAEHVTTDEINNALSRLQTSSTGTHGQHVYCCQKSLDENAVSIDQVTVELKSLVDHLRRNFRFGIDYLLAVCPNGYGGFRPDASEGRSSAVATEIERNGQIIFGRESDRNFFLKNIERFDGAKPKPVFCCSDAHGFDSDPDNGRYSIGENYTWVKAKPTFEGLRQTLYEPELRVQQTDDFIERNFSKPRFTSINLGGEIFQGQAISFEQKNIPLNPNLVAIIGGRGTGKSLFMDSLHTLFHHSSPSNNARNVNVESLNVTIDQGDGSKLVFDSTDNNYSYLHVSQGDVQTFSTSPSDLSNEIKRMLGIYDVEFDPIVTTAITDNIGKYRGFVQYWESTDNQGNRVNNPDYQNHVIEKNKDLMATITNLQNKQLIAQYQQNLTEINEKQALIGSIRELIAEAERNVQQINSSIELINRKLSPDQQVPKVETFSTANKLRANLGVFETEVEHIKKNNNDIVEQFQKQGITQDIASLLDKVSEYQFAIDSAQSKLSEIENKTQSYHEYVFSRAQLVQNYREFLVEQEQGINQRFQALKEPRQHWNQEQNELVASILQDITIIGTVIFDAEKFYQGLERCLNRGRFRATQQQTTKQRLLNTFSVDSVDSFFSLVAGNEQVICEGEYDENGESIKISIEQLLWKNEYFNQGGRFELLNYLFSPESISTYLYVNADFEYKGKTVDKLSVGQRGTFYVCLKLATDPFGSPFVFDQPEDDLDNEFIMQQLVPLFRIIKKYRQVIIVTHNANLVVNTDAEQIIVAHNEGEVISYASGALEDGNVETGDGIKASICNILEGGSYAFEKRERKYGIQHHFSGL